MTTVFNTSTVMAPISHHTLIATADEWLRRCVP
jgi:hypothetical protein